MNYSKIEGYSYLKRDLKTNSIVNTNMSEYKEYVSRRKLKNEENEKIQNLEEEVASIKDDLSEIKSLLRKIANGSR